MPLPEKVHSKTTSPTTIWLLKLTTKPLKCTKLKLIDTLMSTVFGFKTVTKNKPLMISTLLKTKVTLMFLPDYKDT